MLKYLIAGVLICLAGTSKAAEKEVVTINLSINEIFSLNSGLMGLDGYQEIIKDGNQEKSVLKFYKFGSGLRLLIAHDLSAMKTIIADIQIAARKTETDEGKDAVTRMGFEKQALTLEPISTKELDLDHNPIPITVLSALAPILKD